MDEFMAAAIAEAEAGRAEGGIPIGSVLVHQGKILGRGRNRRVQRGSAVLRGEELTCRACQTASATPRRSRNRYHATAAAKYALLSAWNGKGRIGCSGIGKASALPVAT